MATPGAGIGTGTGGGSTTRPHFQTRSECHERLKSGQGDTLTRRILYAMDWWCVHNKGLTFAEVRDALEEVQFIARERF